MRKITTKYSEKSTAPPPATALGHALKEYRRALDIGAEFAGHLLGVTGSAISKSECRGSAKNALGYIKMIAEMDKTAGYIEAARAKYEETAEPAPEAGGGNGHATVTKAEIRQLLKDNLARLVNIESMIGRAP